MKQSILVIFLLFGYSQVDAGNRVLEQKNKQTMETKMDTAVFGAGCFWCVEAVFQTLKGVMKVEPGYSGGTLKNPTSGEVATGNTGHAEVARIIYDPSELSFEFLLSVFFQTHDPTTLNYQGADQGTEYRSAIFYNSVQQKAKAEKIILALDKQQAYPNPIVTEVTKFEAFYLAEDYHLNYYLKNKDQAYCQIVIQPKLDKFKKVFKDYLK